MYNMSQYMQYTTPSEVWIWRPEEHQLDDSTKLGSHKSMNDVNNYRKWSKLRSIFFKDVGLQFRELSFKPEAKAKFFYFRSMLKTAT